MFTVQHIPDGGLGCAEMTRNFPLAPSLCSKGKNLVFLSKQFTLRIISTLRHVNVVFGIGSGVKVFWVSAFPHVLSRAFVKYYFPLWNRSKVEDVAQDVDSDGLPFKPHLDLPIAGVSNGAHPRPTRIWTSRHVELCKKTSNDGLGKALRGKELRGNGYLWNRIFVHMYSVSPSSRTTIAGALS